MINPTMSLKAYTSESNIDETRKSRIHDRHQPYIHVSRSIDSFSFSRNEYLRLAKVLDRNELTYIYVRKENECRRLR
jgi:hypothetical protein